MRRLTFKVSEAEAGERLDKFLAARSGVPREACRRAIAEGGVWISGKRVRRQSLPVHRDKVIELVLDDGRATGTDGSGGAPEPTVVEEGPDWVAIDKPAGLPTEGTLATDQRTALGWAQRRFGRGVRTVHRLDIGTSGVLLLAKSADSAADLSAQFRAKTMRKRYLALCRGQLVPEAGVIDRWLRPSARRGIWEVCASGGVPAVTEYRSLAVNGDRLLVEARPRTGRTHQIRVHLSAAGAPLLGDPRYRGQSSVDGHAVVRPMLHAAELAWEDGKGELHVCRCESPLDFRELQRALGL